MSGYGRFCRHCKAKPTPTAATGRHKQKVVSGPIEFGTQPCPRCNSKMALRSGRYGKFYGCTKFPYCKGVRQTKSLLPSCLRSSTRRFGESCSPLAFKNEQNRCCFCPSHSRDTRGIGPARGRSVYGARWINREKCSWDLVFDDTCGNLIQIAQK